MIIPRPLKRVLGKIIPFSQEDKIPTFNLGSGTADNTTYLRGDGTWAAVGGGSGYVPYTGAINDVDLGTHDLTATQGTFATGGSSDTLTVNHTSGSGKAITITKGGAGEGIYVNKTSGSGNAVTVVGDLEATNLKRTGGTSTQFLKANGSVDNTSYQPTLVSGTNIKTINGNSLLGSGDITVGGGGITVGTTAVTSGTDTRVLFQNGGVVSQSENFTFNDTLRRLQLKAATGSGGNDVPLLIRNSADNLDIVRFRANGDHVLGSDAGITLSLITKSGFSSPTLRLIGQGGTERVSLRQTLNRLTFIHTNSNTVSSTLTTTGLSIGFGDIAATAKLDVKAQGALSTDIALRVRNSANTLNLFTVKGNGVLNAANLPTSAAGLVTGDIWNNAGILTIV